MFNLKALYLSNMILGIGQNDPSRRQLQLGENTIEASELLPGLDSSAHHLVVIPLCRKARCFIH